MAQVPEQASLKTEQKAKVTLYWYVDTQYCCRHYLISKLCVGSFIAIQDIVLPCLQRLPLLAQVLFSRSDYDESSQ